MSAAFDRVLRGAIEAEVAGVPGRDLAGAAETLSRRYRDGELAPGGHRLSPLERLAYAAVRLPATAAALDAVLGALASQGAGAPVTVTDLGAGPATALWPLLARWPSIARITLVDRDPEMLRLGLRLWRRAHGEGPGPELVTLAGDVVTAGAPPADLVIASYAIGELDAAAVDRAVDRALALARGRLVLVEPGTPAGFARIRAARDRVLAGGATIVAPCPHDRACPMAGGDWCHFAARLERSRSHRQLKQAALGWEDEKFSYVIAAPSTPAVDPAAPVPGASVPARIIRRPRKQTGHVRLTLCGHEGLADAIVTRRDPHYREAREAAWGDAWPPS